MMMHCGPLSAGIKYCVPSLIHIRGRENYLVEALARTIAVTETNLSVRIYEASGVPV